MLISTEKHIPQIGDAVQPDQWQSFSILIEGDSYSDSNFHGCQFRLPSSKYEEYQLAVNVTVTGGQNSTLSSGRYKSRCKIEFVGDGKPSIFSGGWIYHD